MPKGRGPLSPSVKPTAGTAAFPTSTAPQQQQQQPKAPMFEQTFRNIDDVLWKEAGCATELDYTEQTSWMLFLKYLDDLEHERAQEAELVGKAYWYIIEERYRWSAWAAPRKPNGEFDHDTALTGADLIGFVNGTLFPYLQGFRVRATGPDTIEYKIGDNAARALFLGTRASCPQV
jgi:hypothetical protein